ncbi:putative glycosyl transferase [Megalodesulfovibrio gigas DSM 1382 = ATCC 19364]|uniref:Putative glycosyl transferase n=1 Tax=Megalodesulfovibrio gigas (strain ATCC 19364 / DSM 1382 / NCIMB 9332 / VKM B-1759) TaxID=1121448 RepID=T2G9N3_MEGG1|nr:putative glycosyl transferase [Megalodesulfovibrio gigas DSM 1382 = ATCC 19364]
MLHVYKVYYPDSHGGIEQVICQLAGAANAMNVRSRVLCLSRTPRPQPIERPECVVHQTKTLLDKASTPIGLEIFRAFPALVREADILHYHFPYPVQDLLHVLHRPRLPSVVTYHSDIIRQQRIKKIYEPLLMHRFLGQVSSIVATSPNYFRTSDILQRYKDKVTVIPIGIDPDAYPTPTAERLAHWRARLPEPFFLFVGVLRYYKGLDILLDAAAGSPHRVVIAGAGPYAETLQRKAAALGLDRVQFLGFIDDADKMALLQCCRGVVFPSHLRSEAFGVTLLEGAMCGKPLISTEIGTGTSYVNEHNVTGLTVAPSDPQALRAAMDTLAADEALAARFGQAARARFESHFTASEMARQYVTLYRSLLERACV